MSSAPLTRPNRGRLLALVVVTGGLSLGMSWFVAQHSESGARWRFVALIGVWVPLWLLGAWAARRLPTRTSLVAILVLAALLRLAAATGTTPSISSDVFRYAWDAHVQLSGIDPYRYPPDAPQLHALRTPGFWPPAAACHHIRARTGCSTINRRGDRTIYPAVAEGWFVVVHLFDPGDAGGRPWQLAGGLVDDAVIVALVLALRDRRRDPRAVAWYALSPLPVIEFAGNGHVDGLALLFMVSALAALQRNRRGWAGVAVGLAIMVKLYPGLALAAGWRRGRWRFLVGAAGVCVVTEVPHVLAVGTRVLGYIPGYLKEEKYTSGGRFLLLGLLGLPGRVTTVLAVAALAAATVHVWRSRLDPATGFTIGLAVLMFVTTPAQPWYAVAVAGVAVLAGRPWLLVVPLAAEPYYAAAVFNDAHQVAIGRSCYGAAALIVAASWWYDRRHRTMAAGGHRDPRPTGRRVGNRVIALVVGATTVLAASACGSSPATARRSQRLPAPAPPLRASPEPAVSPPASRSLPGTVVAFPGAPEGIVVDAAGEVAVSVRRPDGVVLLAIDRPNARRAVTLGGEARHLALAGPDGPLLVPDESDNAFVEMALPSGRVLESVAVGDHPHDAVAAGPKTVFVADELANTLHILHHGRVWRVVAAPLQPGGMAVNPAGTRVVVVGVRGRRITEYTAGGAVVGSANCGAGPTHAVTGDGGLYWVADTDGGHVLGFELSRRGPIQVATIAVGPRPYGLAFDTRTDTLWVTITGTDRLVGLHLDGTRVASRSSYATVRQPNTVAVDQATGEIVVTGSTRPGAVQLLAAPKRRA